MILISAMSSNRVIGAGEGMPWNVPEEYEQFREFIRDQTVVIGRRSYEIFGRDLTSAHTIVVSRQRSSLDGATVCQNLTAALDLAAATGCTIFSCGGSSIYEQTLPLATELYLSTIKRNYSGDRYFPEFDATEWDIAERVDHERFEFVRWVRKAESA